MKSIRVEQFGEPSVMQLKDVSDPSVGPGEVLVRAHAIGVNPVDTYIRAGTYGPNFKVPYTPGSDAAGVVEAVGDGVSDFAPGDRVYTSGAKSGAYAELILCEVLQVHRLPENVSFQQGAALGVPYATAYYGLLLKAKATKGETILVHGATGGVGLAAVQIAVDHGMTVIGTGGTEEGRKLVEEQGAKYVFDHHEPDYREEILGVNCGRGPDVILEMLANVNLGHDLRMIGKRGRVVVIGNRGEVTINPRDAMTREASILAMSLMNATPEDLREIHAYLVKGLEQGTLRPIIREELPLGEAARAHERIHEPGSLGKIVLVP